MSTFIRGVNLGGWLLLERFITPYLFAITDCDIRGDFMSYPGQLGVPPRSKVHQFPYDFIPGRNKNIWSTMECKPILPYPVDEFTLVSAFNSKQLARNYLRRHWDNFVTREDVRELKRSGVTHLRVPMGHWILGDFGDDEPYVDGEWQYFLRLCEWAREEELEVWIDVHTASGSQNGFDNSGHLLEKPTCKGWSSSRRNVVRSLDTVESIVKAIRRDGIEDVVTGFGPLNEPFKDCDRRVTRAFWNDSFNIIRGTFPDMAVYIGDLFNATTWNDGYWTSEKYQNTYLDSHYFHVFAEEPRALSPRQHIAFVCRKQARDTNSCCYQDFPINRVPSTGISRVIGEWSVSFDTLPADKLDQIMDSIASTGQAFEFNRQISRPRQMFLKNFAEAQIVTYEASNVGVSSGWFYWTFKMEGGAFSEWDFLRGIQDGWIPTLLPPTKPSQTVYGTCIDIMLRTNDDMSIIHTFPDIDEDEGNWQGVAITDDLVVNHGHVESSKTLEDDLSTLLPVSPTVDYTTQVKKKKPAAVGSKNSFVFFLFFVIVSVACVKFKFLQRRDYEVIPTPMQLSV